ncbi:calmin isoform X4 [Peromyscus californicus insignis]|uniref:calmin isoform X4 n=1 Tax=Peromyscus californicus insignis TaxID=564181 RepID=UPI0022A7319E|nr:calmin isoform X4 [Peromyscus californicus insignis]
MAAQEWDWFQREELIGQISDIRVQNLQVERENVQKRTFTRWINLHLEKCDPPLEVTDLFVDIQDGKILMALLEVLSGRNLLHEYKSSSHRIFRLNNIAKALKFLEDSNVKLVSIDAAEIADGNPSLVLGLIWNIILFFQIKELTGNLSRSSPSSSLSPGSGGTDSDSSYPPTPTTERSVAVSVKDQRKAIKTLLAWVQRKTRKYGVAVQDFAGSWRSGLAFLAVIKAIDPSLVDMKQALEDSTRENLEKAFRIAHDILHIPRLLEPEDIMVDMPDEQSIVTYVAQFLERFPELEPEDFVNPDKEAPIESTFVRIKESPSEQESRVLLLSENGERAYTINHESSHPPPAKVFVCDQPESTKGFCLGGVPSHNLSDSATEFMHQIIDQVLQESPGKTNEPAPESSILSTRKDSRRSNSLPIKKSVHFEADLHKDASCSKDPFYSSDFRFEGSPRAAKEVSKPDSYVSVVEVAKEKKTEQEARPVQEAASDKGPRDIVGVDGMLHHSQPPQDPTFCNGTVESPASQGEKGPSSPSPGDHTILANSTELKVQLLTVEPMDKDDYFEGISLKASKFNRDLADFASTSQAFGEEPSPHEKTLEEEEGFENYPEKLGKRKSKSPHAETESPESQAEPDKHESPPKDPEQEDQDHPLPPEETPADKKPEVFEKAKRKSTRHRSEEEGEAEDLSGVGGEMQSNPPSTSVSLETLRSHSEEGLDFKPSPPLSKISVIPHDLFYYPHYEVPLAAVLEAYSEGGEDLKNEDADLGEPEEGYLQDSREEEEAHSSQSSCSFSLPVDNGHPSVSDQVSHVDESSEGPTSASGSGSTPSPEDHQQRETKENGPVESQQPQEPPNLELPAKPIEEKLTEASTSSKKKEKRKHVDQVESSLFIAPGTVRSSDDLEENPCEHKIPSRNSHSDSSIYIRRHANRSLELDHFSYVQLRNAADLDERRNRVLNRYHSQKLTELILQFYGIRADMKRESKHARLSMTGTNSSGEAVPLGSQSPPNDSLTQFVQQPDVIYFILFLWLLVYCLLLFPQLDVSRL